MIKVKSIVEITDEYDRENMDKYFQKMTIKDLRNFCLSANSEL